MQGESWVSELKKRVKGEVHIDEKTLSEYSHDASIFEVRPQVVFFPKDERDIENAVRFVSEKKKRVKGLSLTARAGGTDMTGGPLSTSIVMSFTQHCNRLKKIDVKKQTAIVEPGLFYRDFEKATLAHNLFLPSYPASKSICALGGMIANNSAGEKTLFYGKTNKYVRELRVVLADGNTYSFRKLTIPELSKKMKQKNFEGKVYRDMYALITKNYAAIASARPNVTKNSAGYYLWNVYDKKTFDLTQLFVGSQGTLGIMSEATLALVPKKKHSRLIVCYMKDIEALADFVNIVLPFTPESLETFDDATLKLAIKFMPEIAKKIHRSYFSLVFSFWREGLMTFIHGLPKFVVLVEITEDEEILLTDKIIALVREFKERKVVHTVMHSEAAGEKYWTVRRESFNLLRKKVKGKHATAFIDDFVIQPRYLPKFLPELKKILKEYEITPTFAGHAGSGNFHIIPLMDLSQQTERDKIHPVSQKVYALVNKYKGSITAEHNDGLIRSPYLEGMYGKKIMKLFEQTKDIFDPQGIFNPGKKVYSDLNFALEHIKKST